MGAKEKLDVEHKSPCASRQKPLQLAHTTFPLGDVTYLQLEYPLGILDLHFLLGLRLRFTSRPRRGRCRARRGVALAGGSHVCIPGVDCRVEDTDDDSDGDGTNATVCFASDTDDMLGDGTDDSEVYDVSDLNGAIQDMEDEAANAFAPPDIVGSSAAARIRERLLRGAAGSVGGAACRGSRLGNAPVAFFLSCFALRVAFCPDGGRQRPD